jgi:hypothetical protein
MKPPARDPRRLHRDQGIALIMALLILVFMFILGLTFRLLTDQHYIFASAVARRTELYYLAEAGVEYCIAQRACWKDGVPPQGQNKFKLESGWVIIESIIDSGSTFKVTSKGKFLDEPATALIRNNCVTIVAVVDSSGTVFSWQTFYEDK